jgi:hypothetical protein
MILRRVISHFRKQEWTAVFIDFVIVVCGVFIGIQVANWNEARAEAEAFERKLAAVEIEMTENLQRFEIARTQLQRQYTDIAKLRAILDDPTAEASDAQVYALLWQSIRAIHVYPKRNALDVVLEDDLFSELNDRELSEEIESWDLVLADLQREQRDEINFRDGFQNPYFAEHLPLTAILSESMDTRDMILPTRFSFERSSLAADRVLEGILGARQLSSHQNFNNAGDLIVYTAQIIEHIKERDRPQ